MPPTLIRDREALVAELRRRGVDHLAPSDAAASSESDDSTLLASLASHGDPRLRQALVGLFLLHPRLHELVRRLRDDLPTSAAHDLLAYYLAAVYLQEMWKVLLDRYLPSMERLPDDLCREVGLPGREALHGKAGLHALAEWHAGDARPSFNHLSEYEGVAELLLESLRLRRRGVAVAAGR